MPLKIRQELMDCAVSNGRISYHWLLNLYKRGQPPQPAGEVIPACPQCGWLNPVRANAHMWCCRNPADVCEMFTEPAYYQRLSGPEQETP